VTSATTNRPGRIETPLGVFLYRHLQRSLFWGYRDTELEDGQKAYVAQAEKALLDLYYLTPGRIGASYVRELRLDPNGFDIALLRSFAARAAKPKLARAVELTIRLLEEERREDRPL